MVVFIDHSQQNPDDRFVVARPPIGSSDMNHGHPFGKALVLYPFVSGLSNRLDHNDLYNLSSACRQFHNSLVSYRRTLLSISLRCINEKSEPSDPTGANGIGNWRDFRAGKRCSRDIVRPCLRCSQPICRVTTLPRIPSPPARCRLTPSRTVIKNHTPQTATPESVASARPANKTTLSSRPPIFPPIAPRYWNYPRSAIALRLHGSASSVRGMLRPTTTHTDSGARCGWMSCVGMRL